MTAHIANTARLAVVLGVPVCAADENPRGILDEPGDAKTMGYGTSGIAEEVEDPGLGSSATFGGGKAAGKSSAGEPGR